MAFSQTDSICFSKEYEAEKMAKAAELRAVNIELKNLNSEIAVELNEAKDITMNLTLANDSLKRAYRWQANQISLLNGTNEFVRRENKALKRRSFWTSVAAMALIFTNALTVTIALQK